MKTTNRSRQHRAAGRSSPNDIEAELSRLFTLPLKELRAAWIKHCGISAPAIRSRDLLLRLLVWRIQAKAFGSLGRQDRTSAAQHCLAIGK